MIYLQNSIAVCHSARPCTVLYIKGLGCMYGGVGAIGGGGGGVITVKVEISRDLYSLVEGEIILKYFTGNRKIWSMHGSHS